MTVFVFGNRDLDFDSLPLQILPRLSKLLPDVDFEVRDPNEEWEIPEELVVIDTVLGISKPAVFEDLANFSAPPRVSLHDFDVYANLKYLQKLGKIKKIKIIGIPPHIIGQEAAETVSKLLQPILTTRRIGI